MKQISWNKDEIINLFTLVESYKKLNQPLLDAFKVHSEKNNRKCESVRNFYYSFLKRLEADKQLQKYYNIDVDKHKKTCQKFFSPEEERDSINSVKKLLQKGYSVRKACYEIAGGDAKEMLRLQNKFRNTQENNVKTNNVFVMPQRNKSLSDKDINCLFWGLVKLVKNNAREEAKQMYLKEITSSNNQLRLLIKRLFEQERQIEILQKNITLVSNQNNKLEEKLQVMRSNNIIKQKDFQKVEKLKNFMKNISDVPSKERLE